MPMKHIVTELPFSCNNSTRNTGSTLKRGGRRAFALAMHKPSTLPPSKAKQPLRFTSLLIRAGFAFVFMALSAIAALLLGTGPFTQAQEDSSPARQGGNESIEIRSLPIFLYEHRDYDFFVVASGEDSLLDYRMSIGVPFDDEVVGFRDWQNRNPDSDEYPPPIKERDHGTDCGIWMKGTNGSDTWEVTVRACRVGTTTLTARLIEVTGDEDDVIVATDDHDVTVLPPPTPTPTSNAPDITGGSSSVRYSENGSSAVATYTAEDDDGDRITWSLRGSDDDDLSIHGTNGVLTFDSAPDYEHPEDSDGNNVYEVTVVATDDSASELSDERDVTITVTDVNERPTVTSQIGDLTLSVGGSTATVDLSNKFSDPDGDALRYTASISSSSVATVRVNESVLTVTPVAQGSAMLTVTAHDRASGVSGGLSVTQTLSVTIDAPGLAIPAGFYINSSFLRGMDARTPGGKSAQQVVLHWASDANAVKYAVEIRTPGGSWEAPVAGQANSGIVTTNKYPILLDGVSGIEGVNGVITYTSRLADHGVYQFRVKAIDANGRHSQYSETVTLTNGDPVLRVDGDSRNTPSGQGQASVEWQPQLDADSYEIRWRERLTTSLFDPNDQAEWVESGELRGVSTYTVPNLTQGSIYEVQFKYTTPIGPVFSAYSFFVRPGREPAGNGERLASIPLRHYLKDRTYSYHICDETFSANQVRRDQWKNLINAAFERWETATDNLITTVERSAAPQGRAACFDFTEIIEEVLLTYTELTDDDQVSLIQHAQNVLTQMKDTGIESIQRDESELNEIWMVDDLKSYPGTAKEFRDVSWFVARDYCESLCAPATMIRPDGSIVIRASVFTQIDELKEPGNVFTTDILLSRFLYGDSSSNPPTLEIPDRSYGFDSCSLAGTNSRLGMYGAMVHEIGHALGLTYATATEHHPLNNIWSPMINTSCTPFPLDILGLFALYQTDQPSE